MLLAPIRDIAVPVVSLALQRDLETYDELHRLGELRGAMRTLHRSWDRVTLDARERGLLASLLSQEYARQHCLDEARSWLRVALGMRQRDTSSELRRACDVAQLTVRLREGRYSDAIALAERIACKLPAQDPADFEHVLLMWCLAAEGFLQVDAFADCEERIERVLAYPERTSETLRAAALALRGECRVWSYMLALVEGRLDSSDAVAAGASPGGSVLQAAEDDFAAAARYTTADRGVTEALSAWQATVRVLRSFNYMDLQVINSHLERLEHLGLRRERDRQRVIVAFLHLSRGRYELTKGWSQSLALSPEHPSEESGPSGALLVLAAACKGLGDEARAGHLRGSYVRRQAHYRAICPGSLAGVDAHPGLRREAGAKGLLREPNIDRRALLVARATAFVEGHSDGPRHVDVVCEELGVSRRTLEMAFRAITGESPKRYFDTLRARDAAALLREFDGSTARRASFAARIAQRAGFSSYRSFSRIFVQLYGMSPVAAMADADFVGNMARIAHPDVTTAGGEESALTSPGISAAEADALGNCA